MVEPSKERRIVGLGDLVVAASARGDLPVQSWDPPYCGDIGMKIRSDGTWVYAGSPIERARLVKLFSRILRRDTDGRYYLVTPVEKVDVEVEDAPFLAVELDVSGQGRDQVMTFRTNVDDIVVVSRDNPIDFSVEKGSGGLKPYVRVRGGLDALVTRALCYDLVELAVSGPDCSDPELSRGCAGGDDGPTGVWSKGVWFALPT